MWRFFEEFPEVVGGFSSKADGNMTFKHQTGEIIKNRKFFLNQLDLDLGNVICAEQPHGSRIAVVGEAQRGLGAFTQADQITGADGLVTDQVKVVLAIFTADCLPLFFFSPKNRVIAAVHASWRCLRQGIIGQVAKTIKNAYDLNLDDFHLAFGPHIKKCCFEVQADCWNEFADYPKCRIKNRGRLFIDLDGVVKEQLMAEGFDLKKLRIAEQCTGCDQRYFSCRREKAAWTGEMMGVISLIS